MDLVHWSMLGYVFVEEGTSNVLEQGIPSEPGLYLPMFHAIQDFLPLGQVSRHLSENLSPDSK